MARVLSTVVVLALLAATAAAFAITEGAKLTKSPIYGTSVPRPVFSPDSPTLSKRTARIAFRLRTSERITVAMRDSGGHEVRTLLPGRTVHRGTRLDLTWDGFTDDGLAAPDGVYSPVVKLQHSHRTIILPSPVTIDTKAPVVTVRHPVHAIISPDGDGRHDSFHIAYRSNERGHGILAVRGKRVWFTKCCKAAGEVVWNGKLHKRPARPSQYLLTISAEDTAGNVSKPFPFALVQVRYLALARQRVVVKPGAKFALRVSTDAPSVRWRMNGRSGVLQTGTLHFRAPKSAGVYRLYVFAAGHAARCSVVVA